MQISINPKSGNMSSFLFENENVSLDMTHFINITIELQPISIDGEIEETEIQLDFIRVPFRSFSDIENKTFSFPINPDDGYIDGSIYLFEDHIPVDVTNIMFETFSGNCINANFIGEVNFLEAGYEIPNCSFDINVELSFRNIFIPPDIVEPKTSDFSEAQKLLESFFTLKELNTPKIENNGFQDMIVFEKST